MPNRFANGVRAIAMCDRCGQQYKLKKLKTEIIKQRKYQLLVCEECWDPDHPQLMLGTFPVEDPQALRNPRRDNTYITAGQNNDGVSTGGSRDIQWGWNPVGGASYFDTGMTPNYLIAGTYVGDVTAGVDIVPGAALSGVSSTGAVGNALGPLPVSGVSAAGSVGSLSVYEIQISGVSGTVSTGGLYGPVRAAIGMTFNIPGADFYLSNNGTLMRFYWSTNATNLSTINSMVGYLAPNNGSGYSPSMNVYIDASTTNPAPVGTPTNSFGLTNGGQVWSIYSYTDINLSPVGGYPVMPDGHYYIGNTLQSVAEFFIPCPSAAPGQNPPGAAIGGYAPAYAQVGPNSTLTWTGPAAQTINSSYQLYGSQVAKPVFVGWLTSGGSYVSGVIGTVTSINYDSGTQTFTITMVTATPMTNFAYTTTSVYFLHVNI